jgi:hypothetical protein
LRMWPACDANEAHAHVTQWHRRPVVRALR